MKITTLETERIQLRPMVDNDLPIFFDWMSDIRNLHLWWADRNILSYNQFVDDFYHRDRSFFGHFFTIAESNASQDNRAPSAIGLTYTYNLNYIDKFTYLAVYLVPEKTRQDNANIFL